MNHDNKTRDQLLERIEELELLNRELLAEKEQEIRLEYAWTGNLGHWYWNIKTNAVTFNPLKPSWLVPGETAVMAIVASTPLPLGPLAAP